MQELHSGAYALAWLLGTAIVVTLVLVWISRGIVKWLQMIDTEKRRKAAEDALLAKAIARGQAEEDASRAHVDIYV
jgi:hypothetical protein